MTKDQKTKAERIIHCWRVNIQTIDRIRRLAYERKVTQGQILEDAIEKAAK